MMIRKRKVLSVAMCFMMIGVIASLVSGCAGGGGGGGGGGGTETPQYGGVLNLYTTADPVGWDDAVGNCPHYNTAGCYQTLWSGDWSKGIAGGYGTKQADWLVPGDINRLSLDTGRIAQSWEIGSNYIIFHLRDGVKFAYSATKAEAVTADDVVVSINRNKQSGAYLAMAYPSLAAAMSASKVDDHTVRIDCTAVEMPELISMIDFMYIYPADVINDYGDVNDWTRAIGTGPFYVKNYVEGSEIDYARNPNYWETNPVGPGQGNQLPYLDGVRVFIQPDPSTEDSLFTTGQVDITMVDYDRAQSLITLPDVNYVEYFSDAGKAVICMRTDKANLPYQDLRVRQALTLGIDHQTMVEQLYGGEGDYLYWPLTDCKEYHNAYLALNDYPATPDPQVGPDGLSVKDLYTYNPDKAKQLLADAGYPDGFKCTMYCWNLPIYTDQLQVVKSMWADIGVDLTLKPVDYATISVRMFFRNYEDMMAWGMAGAGTYFKGTNWYGSSMWNGSYIDDPVLNSYHDQMLAAWTATDDSEAMSIHRELLPYLQEQCYVIQMAAWSTYAIWWPWVKNYSGEGSLGYYKFINSGLGGLTQYIWIDQDLKTSMGY
jgi:peptide/nickel transport system substrate-binding protein